MSVKLIVQSHLWAHYSVVQCGILRREPEHKDKDLKTENMSACHTQIRMYVRACTYVLLMDK